MKKRFISWVLTLIMVVSAMQGLAFSTAMGATGLFEWNKSDTLDASLTLVDNKAGEDDVLLEVDVNKVGDYELVYYLEDGRRTTVNFTQKVDELALFYKVEDSTGANITQELVSNSYQEMDYTMVVPDWVYDDEKMVETTGGALEFKILRNASTQYNGYAFEIDQKKVYFKWDFQTGIFYYQIMNVAQGTLLPVQITDPAGSSQTSNILKSLADFKTRPTHFVYDPITGGNMEMSPIIMPGDETPGERPGIELSFLQPKAWNYTTWTYEADNDDSDHAVDYSELTAIIELTDVASENNYLDFQIPLYEGDGTQTGIVERAMADMPVEGGVNADVVYTYNIEEQRYKVQIVQDKTGLDNDPDQFLQWSGLTASKIYNTAVNIQVESGFLGYGFRSYTPVGGFAYTYMAYEIKRANMSEAYLDITPYDAGSQEETEYSILYSKAVPAADEDGYINLDPDDDLWVKHYYTDSDGSDHILIPVPFKAESSQDVYQVVVKFSGTDLNSEVLNYQAINDNNVPPTTPMIDNIDNLYIVPSPDVAVLDPSTVQFDLAWTAPENSNMMELDTIFADDNGNSEDDRIYYELMVNEVPTDTVTNPYRVIRVFEVYKDETDGTYKVARYSDDVYDVDRALLHEGLPGMETAAETATFNGGYNEVDGLFRMDGISIYSQDLWDGGWASILTTEADDESDPNAYTVMDQETSYNFEYPGVNYLRMRAVAMIDGKLGISEMSIPVSLSLSDLTYDVPIPEALSYDPVVGEISDDPVGIDLQWYYADYESYESHMLVPVGLSVTDVAYRVYMAQDKSVLGTLIPKEAVAAAAVFDEDNPEIISEETLTALRRGELVYFDVDSDISASGYISRIINGLDPNENYYIRLATLLQVVDGEISASQVRYSNASELISVTTPMIPEPPDEGDIRPLSVENLEAVFLDDTSIIGKLSWDLPDEILFAQNRFGFEFISTEDMAIPETLRSSNYSLEDLAESEDLANANMKLWRLLIEDGEVALYEYKDGSWSKRSDADEVITIGDQHIEFIDGSNMTNRVYYYYVRTINVIGGTINAASTWQMDTLTTAQVKPPINLAVDYGYTTDYDDLHEAIIRFDAPIPINSDLADDYVIELYVKGEEDSDYSLEKYTTTYLEEVAGPSGYTRFYYQISDLLAGKAYSVKVRIEDRTKNIELLPDGSSAYPKSPFSEILMVRTEFSQEDYDKSTKYQSYLDYYDKKVKEFEQGEYVVLENSTTQNVVKYRDNYALGSLENLMDGAYDLYVEDVDTNVYYLPAQFIEALNDNQATLQFVGDMQSLEIRPYSMGIGMTDAIDEMVSDIADYEITPVDYYVKLTIGAKTTAGTINDKSPSGEVVDVHMDVIGALKMESEIDARMISELEEVVAWQREILEKNLAEELVNGIDDRMLLDVVDEALNEVERNYCFAAGVVMEDEIETSSIIIPSLAKSMLIYMTPVDTTALLDGVKKYLTTWVTSAAVFQGDSYLIESAELTSYALIAKGLSGSTLTGYTTTEISVINKYALYDIFTMTELTQSSKNLQKYRLIPVFAKMLGAKDGVDTAALLKEKGIAFSAGNLYADLSREEVLYVYTQVFGKKNGISLSSGKITNYNIIKDISTVQTSYQQTLLIGANLKMFETDNGLIDPKGQMTIRAFIKLLARMEKGLNG